MVIQVISAHFSCNHSCTSHINKQTLDNFNLPATANSVSCNCRSCCSPNKYNLSRPDFYC